VSALALLAMVLPGGTAAQTTASIEAGVTRVRYAGTPAQSLFAVSPLLQFDVPDGWFAAAATISAFEGGDWGLQGTVTGSRYLRPVMGLTPELSGLAEAGRAVDGTRAGEASVRGRVHMLGASEGAWLGGGLGWADGVTGTRGVGSVELGGWLTQDAVTLMATVEPEWVGDSIRTTDVEGLARLVQGPVELSVFGGVRRQSRPLTVSEAWGGATAAWWFGSSVAATLGVGSYPADLAREFGSGRYATFALRFATRRPQPADRADQPVYRLLPPLARPVVAEFSTVSAADGYRRIAISAPGARSVELMGDFTDWQPVLLRNLGGGRWELDLPLGPGVHRLNVRVNGEEWGVPPGIPVVRDDFSGVVGLLTIR
jgi:hypothetical protein